LPLANVDADMILPGHHVKTDTRSGLGVGLFHDLRYHADGSPNPDFILNQPAYRRARILVAGPNLGSGSSREHAAWALDDFGIRCVISSMIADTFSTNCVSAGVLPLVLEQMLVDELMADATVPQTALMTIDLETQEIVRAGGQTARFDVPSFVRERLLQGADEIDRTLRDGAAIGAVVAKRKVVLPCL
jgi:3-isopropylmalate/(R)-2-methylmalate dehydratase small subunit